MRKARFRLYSLALPLICMAVFTIGSPWNTFQMESVFGLASAADATSERLPYWMDDPAPARLSQSSEIPPLRAVTYNLHSGFGSGWRLFASRSEVKANLRAIARRIVEAAPVTSPVDVVGLNEVDFHSRRSGWTDQAAFLADELSSLTGYIYSVVRGETWRRNVPGLEVRFGNAVLVRHPVMEEHVCELGSHCVDESGTTVDPAGNLFSRILGEKRGIVRVRIDFHDQPVDVLVTHLEAFVLKQREVQAAEILRNYVRPGVPTVLLGDINAVPSDMTAARGPFAADRTHDILTSGKLVDARVRIAALKGLKDLSIWSTYPALEPEWPLDGVFATADLLPQAVRVVGADESDHRGLLVSYGWLDEEMAAKYGRWHDSMRRRQLGIIMNGDLGSPEPEVDRRVAWLASATGFGEIIAELMKKPVAL
jgi:endonuclease/exonuclease/phosphatase family metal-dependent hydrolase